jgi:ferritin-like metal-binding protein YciE
MEPLLNLRDLLQHEIDDLYSAEEQIIEAMPAMVESATNRQLKAGLNEHLKVTKEQKKRLDKVRSLLKSTPEDNEEKKGLLGRIFGSETKCKGVEGLIKEGEKMMSEEMDPKVMDAAIIASAQKIEHYEISGYGTARAFAAGLGLREVATLLETTLNEEYKSDNMLTSLALNKVNVEAEEGSVKGKQNGNSGRGNGQKSTNRRGSTSSRSGGTKSAGPANKKGTSKKSASKKAAPKKAAPRKAAPKKSASKKQHQK